MRTCDIINELEDTELANKLRRAYIESGIDIEIDYNSLTTAIMRINWGSGESERYWDKQYTIARKAEENTRNTNLLIEHDDEEYEEEYEDDDYEEVV